MTLGGSHVKSYRMFVLTIGATIASAALIGAQQKSTGTGSGTTATPAANVTYVGCLSPGSGENAYLLTNGKQKGVKGKDTPRVNFKLVAAERVRLEPHVTHEVSVTGTLSEAPAAAAASGASGETLRTFTVTAVKTESTSCG